MCNIASAGILPYNVPLLHQIQLFGEFFAVRWIYLFVSHWYLLCSFSISFPRYNSFTEHMIYIIFLYLPFLEGEKISLLWLLPSLPHTHWPVKLEQFTTANSLRTATNSEKVLWFPVNTIYLFTGSSCLWGKIKQTRIFSCFYLWITLNLLM